MPSIRDFSGGVLNQELQNRDNGNGVLFDCKNVLSSWNGELRKRTGTRWLKSLTGNSKIIPYRLPDGNDMIMVLRDKVINCYKFDNDGNFVPYTVSTGTILSFPDTGWTSNSKGDWEVFANTGYNNPDSDAFYSIIPAHSGPLGGKIGCIYYPHLFQSGWWYGFENINTNFVFGSVKIIWVSSYGGGYHYKAGLEPIIQYSDDGINWTSIKTDISSIKKYSEEETYNGVTTKNACYEYVISNNIHTSTHRYWRIYFNELYEESTQHTSLNLRVEDVDFKSSISINDLIFNNCPYENDDLDNIRWSQNDKTITMACKGKQPYQITISSGSFSDSLFVPSDYSNMWTALGYPYCVTYYQNRLWFGGFDIFPTRVYASEFDDGTGAGFAKFTIPSPIVATSPIKADGTEISNVIENMWGGNNALYCLSADGISMVDAQGAIVATDQVEFKLRNREPVNAMVPTVKDDIMIYLGRDKRKILVTDFDFVVQRFRANCISDNYNNFLQSGIRELHYIPRKSSLIYGVLEDGKWFAQLFSTDKSKNALYPFEINGKVIDIQPIKRGDETKLLMITQLPTYEYIIEEKIAQPDQEIMDFMTEQEKQDYTQNVISSSDCYLDHSITKKYDVATATITDLPYFTGDKITVIADGMYLGEHTVVLNEDTNKNEIVLDEPVNQVVLGYTYDSYAVLKFVSPYNMRKFPKEISVNFINSGYLEVGNTFDSLKPVLKNLVDSVSVNNKKILMNGNYTKTLDKQAFETPYVIVRSDKGLPFIITGIDYKVDMSNYQGGV